MSLRPGVFLDRDGTINREVDYLADPELFELLPGVGEGLARLRDAGFGLVVVTNQSGIARGLLDERILAEIHARMARDLAAFGVEIDLALYSPYHPDVGPPAFRAESACRKPGPGMLLEGAARMNIDLRRSWTVGDSLRDIEAGRAVGVQGVLVRTGKGRSQEPRAGSLAGGAPPIVDGFAEAVDHILARG